MELDYVLYNITRLSAAEMMQVNVAVQHHINNGPTLGQYSHAMPTDIACNIRAIVPSNIHR